MENTMATEALSVSYLLLLVVIVVVGIISMWKIFEKAEVPGWYSLIPILNTVYMFKISGLNPWLVLLLIVPFVNLVVAIILAYNFVKSFGFGIGGLFIYLFFSPILMLYIGFSEKVTYQGQLV